ncbi:MAG: hypothetical protein IPN17_19400 [Deltaproteobacteria bacterium]|nr:hypothetical protein [Deltaproteobacteria bacterium]
MHRGLWVVAALSVACSGKAPALRSNPPTCGSLEVQHGGVTLGSEAIARGARVPCGGSLSTDAGGRAVIRTDDGLELRVAGDTRLRFADGVPSLERGRVFAIGGGAEGRGFQIGDARVEIGDAALELERDAPGVTGARVIVVRGEVAWRQGRQQGLLAQGESLEGNSSLTPRPASVWDDWTGGAASPQGIARPRGRGVGAAFAHVTDGEAPVALAVRSHEVRAVIRGDLAVTTVEQRFFNGSPTASPVDWRLPLPDGALISQFRVGSGAGPWTDSSPAVLSQVSRDGGTSALYADEDGNVRAFLGQIAPGQELRVSVTWTEWLPRDGARRRYVAAAASASEPPLVGEYSVDVDVSRAGAHGVAIPAGARLVDGHVRLRRSDYRPRGETAVELTDDASTAPSARAWNSAHGDVTSLAVDLTLPTPSLDGSDVIVVVDDSAGTERSALEMARAAVDAMLRQLGASDRVALWFGDLRGRPAAGPAGTLARLDDARREAIVDAVARVRLGGATNLGRLLADANAALDPSRNGVVIYLGDATPTVGPIDPSRLRDDLRRQAPDLRLYVLGLGSDAHPEVLAPLAAGAHATERASDRAEAVAASARLVARALQPMLRDVTVTAGRTVHTVLPARVDRWFAGDPLRFVGVVEGALPKEVRVRARVGGEVRAWTLPIRPTPVFDEGDLQRRWAHLRVRDLIAQGGSRGAVADLGARFGLVTSVSGLALGGVAEGSTGLFARSSLWDEGASRTSLPSLGIAEGVSPRGIARFGEHRAAPIAIDDGTGWTPTSSARASASAAAPPWSPRSAAPPTPPRPASPASARSAPPSPGRSPCAPPSPPTAMSPSPRSPARPSATPRPRPACSAPSPPSRSPPSSSSGRRPTPWSARFASTPRPMERAGGAPLRGAARRARSSPARSARRSGASVGAPAERAPPAPSPSGPRRATAASSAGGKTAWRCSRSSSTASPTRPPSRPCARAWSTRRSSTGSTPPSPAASALPSRGGPRTLAPSSSTGTPSCAGSRRRGPPPSSAWRSSARGSPSRPGTSTSCSDTWTPSPRSTAPPRPAPSPTGYAATPAPTPACAAAWASSSSASVRATRRSGPSPRSSRAPPTTPPRGSASATCCWPTSGSTRPTRST